MDVILYISKCRSTTHLPTQQKHRLFPLLATLPAAIVYRLSDPDENDLKSEHVALLPKILNDKSARSIGPFVNEYVGTFLLTGAVTVALATGKVAAPLVRS